MSDTRGKMPSLRYLHIGVLVSLCLESASPYQAWPVPPRDIMADITNDLGICLLQVVGRESRDNIAFSPYGVMSIVFLLYEGSHGNTAVEIYNSLRLPWDRHMSRIGFRDLHRHIKSYFSNDRFLRGLVLSKPSVPLKNEYVRLLNFYGFFPNKDGSTPTAPAVPPADSEGKGRPDDHMHTEDVPIPTYVPTKGTTRRPTYATPRPTTLPPPVENEYVTNEYTRPSTEYVTKPSTKDYVTKPSTKDYVTKPSTKDYVTKPTTYYPSTGYDGGSSDETEPTLPPYDPTKYPSKTTYMYSTDRKPMRTTKNPSYTTGMSTVKPGYNSHGMTQFFPSTTPRDKYTDSDNDRPTIEENTIGDEPHQNGHRQPTTDSGVYTPPKHGVTDPFTTEPYFTSNRVKTTTRSTTPSYDERENELPVHFPDKKPDSDHEPTPPTNSEEEDKVFYPTESTSETDDNYTGIDVRFGDVKETTPVSENTPSISSRTEAVASQAGSNDNEIAITTEATSKTEDVSSIETTTKSPENIETVLEVEAAKSITDSEEKNAKIMTRKEVETANQMVDVLNKTVTEPPTETTSLATILMSLSYSNNATAPDISTESSTELDPSEKATTRQPATVSVNVETTDKPADNLPTLVTIQTITDKPASTESTTPPTETPLLNRTQSVNNANTTEQQDAAARKKRTLIGPPSSYDHRDGSNNWIPAGEGPHWEYNVPRDQWFFTYSGSEPVPVLTYMDYLPFAFIESINTLALRLPLDDPRYSMLILLPMERYGLDQLLASLHQCSIREVLRDLRVIPVYAVLPAFTLVKHINLVPALTQMGMEEVFDPSRADLSGMASEPHLYVRSVEQLVTVSLRKYHYSTRRFDGRPEDIRHHFIANHPFIYFVLDTETNAALMAGTIVNPTAYNNH